MKIICDSCGAKYSIADEKVQGKVFKIRCKKCSDVIVVKGVDETAQPEEQEYGGYDNAGGGAAEWYVVIDGERVGPITPEEVNAYYTAGQLQADTYVWRDGLDDWVMLETLSEFAHLTHDTAGPEEATMISTRSSVGEDAYGGAAAAASGASAAGGAQSYGGGAGLEAAGYDIPDAGESTMVMDSGRFQKEEFESFQGDGAGSTNGESVAAVESGSYDSVTGSGGFEQQSSNGHDAFGEEPAQDLSGGYDSGGGYDDGGYDDGGYDDGGYDDGGYEAEQGGGGMFAAFDSGDGGDQDYQADDYGQESDASPDLSGGKADDLVGARNENSVLFSLSSVDQVKAVSKPTGGAGQAEGSDKSGLIDIQALASTHAAMKGGGGAKDDEDEFVAGTMSVPALMPMGSHKSNTPLIIGISVGAAVVLLGMAAIIIFLLMGDGDEDEVLQPGVVAEVDEEQQPEEKELTEEEQAEADEAEAAAAAALAAKEAEEEQEEEEEEEEEEVAEARPTRTKQAAARPAPRQETKRPAPTPPREEKSGGSIIDRMGDDSSAQKSEPAADLPDSLSRSMVQSTIRRYNSQVASCSQNSNSGGLSGRAQVRFVVQGNGSVTSADTQGEFSGTDVGSCIEGVVRGMRFPATQDDRRTITYPFAVR